jgi:hypothetical protein
VPLSTETARSDKWGGSFRLYRASGSRRGSVQERGSPHGLHPFAGWLKRMRRVSDPNDAKRNDPLPVHWGGSFLGVTRDLIRALRQQDFPVNGRGSGVAMGSRLTPITLRRFGHAEVTISRSANPNGPGLEDQVGDGRSGMSSHGSAREQAERADLKVFRAAARATPLVHVRGVRRMRRVSVDHWIGDH